MAKAKEKEPSPSEQIAGFARGLASGPLPRAIVLRGDERWFREVALGHALAAAKRASMEIEKHDAQDPDFDLRRLLDALRAVPMFSAARCVVVRNAAALFRKEGGEDAPLARALIAFWKDASNPGAAVIEADGLRADHALVKAALASGGTSLALRRLWDSPPPWNPDPRKSELVMWLQARAREKQISLSSDDAFYVATVTGNDLFALDATLDSLARRGGKNVRAWVSWSSGGSPFDLAERMCRGDVAGSIAGIEVLFKAGFQDKSGERELDRGALLAITLGALRSKVRAAVAAGIVLEKGGDMEKATHAAIERGSPRAYEELALRMRAREPRAWRGVQDDLIEVERRTRRGGTVDASDLCELALRWRIRTRTPSPTRAR